MMESPKPLDLSADLLGLIEACQVDCDPGCCGICAFTFSPVHTAAYLSRSTGAVTESHVSEIKHEIEAAFATAAEFPPNEKGHVCSIEPMCEWFTAPQLARLKKTLFSGLDHAQRIFQISSDSYLPYNREPLHEEPN